MDLPACYVVTYGANMEFIQFSMFVKYICAFLSL